VQKQVKAYEFLMLTANPLRAAQRKLRVESVCLKKFVKNSSDSAVKEKWVWMPLL
jgi:hypothetical protein